MNKIAPTLIAAAVISAFLPAPQAFACDHIDSPTLAQDHASDIGDTMRFSIRTTAPKSF